MYSIHMYSTCTCATYFAYLYIAINCTYSHYFVTYHSLLYVQYMHLYNIKW